MSGTPEIPVQGDVDPPVGWAIARLEDLVADVQPGFACGEHNRGGDGIGHLRPMNVTQDGQIDLAVLKFVPKVQADAEARLAREGDVIFNNTNSPELVGKTALYSLHEPRAFSNHMTRVRCRSEALDPAFCAMSLHQRWRTGYFVSVCNNHVSQASVGRAVLLDTRMEVPPLAEQKRIVAKVEELLARVNVARERLAKLPGILKRFRQSVLAAACSGRLTEEWREDQLTLESAETALKNFGLWPISVRRDLELPELPEKWIWADVDTLIDRDEAFCYGVVQPGEDDPNGVCLIRAGDLDLGSVETATLRRIPTSVDAAYGRSRVRGGELLVTVVGAGIGESAIVPSHCAGFNIARAVAKIPIRQFSARYVLRWLQTQIARSWMDGDAREVARPTLNLEQLRTLPIPLPPLAEQHEIVRRVEALFALADKIEARVKSATARVEKITQAILAKAFRGELVPTEAELARQEGRDYEPASALLDRIRASRDSAAAGTEKPRSVRRKNRTARK